MESGSVLSVHREAGEWWNREPYSEYRTYIDDKGIRRTSVKTSPSLSESYFAHESVEYVENNREDYDLRIRKTRDEKVGKATGRHKPVKLPTYKVTQSSVAYAALHTLSAYAFGRSSIHAEEIPVLAAKRGIPAVALADPFSLIGAIEFAETAKKVGVKPLVGSLIELPEGGEICLIARTKRGYVSLSRLVTECHMSQPRLYPLSSWEALERHREGLLCLTGGSTSYLNWLLAKGRHSEAKEHVQSLVRLYGQGFVFIQVERSFLPGQQKVEPLLLELAETLGLRAVAGGPVTHASRSHFPALDVIACMDSLCLIDGIVERKPKRHETQAQGRFVPRRPLNAERYLKSAKEMSALFADRLDLLANTLFVSDLCEDDVLPARTVLPKIAEDENKALRELCMNGLNQRPIDKRAGFMRRMEKELTRIFELGFAGHFMVAWDFCRYAKENGIHFSARGSVVDSLVAYALGFSRINAYEHRLHFERFLPADGSKRPDIDIDFEAKHRNDIREYVSKKYGPDHVATVAAISAFNTRGIVREVGKVMGLPEESIGFLAKRVHGGVSPDSLESALEKRPELRDSNIPKERFRWVFRLAARLMDIPRHIGAHSSGVIISSIPIRDTVPVMISGLDEIPIIQWDKRSARRCFDKFDILCLRGQDVLSDTEEKIRLQDAEFCVDNVPTDDPEVYRIMRAGQLIGIPQSASPAMRQAHQRLRTENLTDASLVQAGIRPGVGGAVKLNELIARRRGKPYSFDHPKLKAILGQTYGIIVFQEQVDLLLQEFCRYTSGEAEEIREAIHKKRREDYAAGIKEQVMRRIVDNGFSQAIADQVFELISGFQGYGFAQGHALAFAEISTRSVWCQQNFPSEYFAALLNAQPAGYYGPATIMNEARIRGVKPLGPDINKSLLSFTVEPVQAADDPKIIVPNAAIRVGLNQLEGLSGSAKDRFMRERDKSEFESFFDFVARVRPERDELEALILCGAFDALHPNRRALLWAIPDALEYSRLYAGLGHNTLPLIPQSPSLPTGIDDYTPKQKAVQERKHLGLDIARHLMAFERERTQAKGGLPSATISALKPGEKVFAVGNPIRLRFPPTMSGKRVVFFDLEDETGLLNVTCFDETYQRYGHAIVCSPYATVRGVTQDRDGHTAFLATAVYRYTPSLHEDVRAEDIPLKVGDFLVG